MKKFLFGAVALFLMMGCAGGGTTEATSDDAKAQAVAEQAQLDSIAKVELALSAIPTFSEIVSSRNTENLFKNKGFNVTVEYEFYENDAEYYPHVKATYNPGFGISCDYTDWLLGFTITIKGAPELLDRFYADAQSYIAYGKREGMDGSVGWSATRKGDAIEVYLPDMG